MYFWLIMGIFFDFVQVVCDRFDTLEILFGSVLSSHDNIYEKWNFFILKMKYHINIINNWI